MKARSLIFSFSKNIVWIFLVFVSIPQFSFAQENAHPKADSLQRVIEKSPDDTNKVRLQNSLFQEYVLFDVDKAMVIAQEMRTISQKLNYSNGMILADDNIARIYWVNQDTPNALKFLQEKLEYCEKSGRQIDVANCYNNMGAVYRGAKNPDMALEYFQKSFVIREQLKDTSGLAGSYANIGLIYFQKGDYRKSLGYYFKSKAIRQQRKDLKNLALIYTNIGTAYLELDVYDSSKIALDSSLLLYKILGDQIGLATAYQNMGSIYRLLKQPENAIAYLDSAIIFARKAGIVDVIINAYGELSTLEESRGNDQAALSWYKKKFDLNDSVFNKNMSGQMAEMEAKYNSEKQKRENEKLKSEASYNAVVSKLLYFITALGILVAAVFFYAYRNKRKSNLVLEYQNQKIETQKKEITDSITYAQRIQQAILPSNKALVNYFPNAFVLYLPKAIVSGDFWWMNEVNSEIQIAVADCTGHGVPGAFMSMLGVDKLTAIAQSVKNPDEVLSELNRSIKLTLQQVEGNNNDEVRDGMDIAFVKFNSEKNNLLFSGANRPIWIFDSNKVFKELKPTKAALGGHTSEQQKFDLSSVPLQQGDTIYLFSDGFADQFGGTDGKKIMTRRMRDWVVEIQGLSMKDQHKKLLHLFSEWKGKNEQVDDVLVIGIRV